MTTEETRKYVEEMVEGPGKFEAEPAYVAYFWEKSMDGYFDTIYFDGSHVEYTRISADDVDIFPELAESAGRYIALQESEQGLVYASILDEDELQAFLDSATEEETE